ncbi:MAG: hypothetical protein AB7F19_02300 [Candidatus Babeliales bacterium]
MNIRIYSALFFIWLNFACHAMDNKPLAEADKKVVLRMPNKATLKARLKKEELQHMLEKTKVLAYFSQKEFAVIDFSAQVATLLHEYATDLIKAGSDLQVVQIHLKFDKPRLLAVLLKDYPQVLGSLEVE